MSDGTLHIALHKAKLHCVLHWILHIVMHIRLRIALHIAYYMHRHLFFTPICRVERTISLCVLPNYIAYCIALHIVVACYLQMSTQERMKKRMQMMLNKQCKLSFCYMAWSAVCWYHCLRFHYNFSICLQ